MKQFLVMIRRRRDGDDFPLTYIGLIPISLFIFKNTNCNFRYPFQGGNTGSNPVIGANTSM
jgi:hypothetical protein